MKATANQSCVCLLLKKGMLFCLSWDETSSRYATWSVFCFGFLLFDQILSGLTHMSLLYFKR